MYHVVSMIYQISYDSEQLKIDRKEPGFQDEMGIFKDRADLLQDITIQKIKQGFNNPSYRREFTRLYKEAETLKIEVMSSQLFDSYKRFVAMGRIDNKLFGSVQ